MMLMYNLIEYSDNYSKTWKFLAITPIFFLSGFSFTATDDSQDSKGRDGTIFYSTLPLPPAYERSDISMQLCM